MKSNYDELKQKVESEINSYKELDSTTVDFNKTLSFIYHYGILKALNNKDLKYNRDLTNKINRLHSKFTGFKVRRDNDNYLDVNFFTDIELVGEILTLEYFSGAFKKYEKIHGKEFPMYFSWFPEHCLVCMTPDFKNSNYIGDKFNSQLSSILPGTTDLLTFDQVNPDTMNSYLFYFAENGLPKETSLDKLSEFVNKISVQ